MQIVSFSADNKQGYWNLNLANTQYDRVEFVAELAGNTAGHHINIWQGTDLISLWHPFDKLTVQTANWTDVD